MWPNRKNDLPKGATQMKTYYEKHKLPETFYDENTCTEYTPYKFECDICGCYFWVPERDGFECPNCRDRELIYLKDDKERNQ
jgi:Zn finger protein HypA/HybF involved in hydrogenase expression